jgi:hypothetical protein
MTREEHLAFCRREIEACVPRDSSLEERMGATLGEMDWRAMESILMEEGGQESME